MSQIRVKAMCIIEHDGKLLVSRYWDEVKQEYFYRLLGGSMEFGETAEETIRREIKEEINSDLLNLRFLQMVENMFTFEGKPGHEVIFLYTGEISRTELFHKSTFVITEGYTEVEGMWVLIQEAISGPVPLYPACDYKSILV